MPLFVLCYALCVVLRFSVARCLWYVVWCCWLNVVVDWRCSLVVAVCRCVSVGWLAGVFGVRCLSFGVP